MGRLRGLQLAASALFATVIGLASATSAASPAPASSLTGGHASSVAGKEDEEMPQCAKDWDKCMQPCFDRLGGCYGACIKTSRSKGQTHECIVRCDKSKDKCEKDHSCHQC
jgi:hypothetical protein